MTPESLSEILRRPAPEAFAGFMARWHGWVPGRPALPGTERLGAALRPVYEAFGTAPSAYLEMWHLRTPENLREEDGVTVFCVEEQSVWLWGLANGDLDGSDPPVLGRENRPGQPWAEESQSVSVFMLQLALTGAAFGGPHSAAAGFLAPEETKRVLAALTEVDLPPWRFPGDPSRWYAGDDAIAFASANRYPDDVGEPHQSVWISSRTEDGVRFVEPHLSDAWEYYSPRDSLAG